MIRWDRIRAAILPLPLLLSACAAPRVILTSVHPVAVFTDPRLTEASGLAKSALVRGVFWTHNDSGDRPRLLAIDTAGHVLSEITVDGASHVDWEEVAADRQGRLYIGDIGNNWSNRGDLAVYLVAEPDPRSDAHVGFLRRISFSYPDQRRRGAPYRPGNFDAEALFVARGSLWLLTRDWTDDFTRLYRFPDSADSGRVALEFRDRFKIGGMVTGAAVNDDESLLAVLTYDTIWIFDIRDSARGLFSGRRRPMPIYLRQAEGIAWDGDTLWVINEQEELYRLRPGPWLIGRPVRAD